MAWYWIVLLTIVSIELITNIISLFSENAALQLNLGIVYWLLFVLLYPLRAIRKYNRSSGYYQKHGISKLQYFFGKRVRNPYGKAEDPDPVVFSVDTDSKKKRSKNNA